MNYSLGLKGLRNLGLSIITLATVVSLPAQGAVVVSAPGASVGLGQQLAYYSVRHGHYYGTAYRGGSVRYNGNVYRHGTVYRNGSLHHYHYYR